MNEQGNVRYWRKADIGPDLARMAAFFVQSKLAVIAVLQL